MSAKVAKIFGCARFPWKNRNSAEADNRAVYRRDHHVDGFTYLVGRGGVKGGYVHGATGELGLGIAEDPVHVHDLHATILHLFGLDHKRLTYRYSGRDFRLTDVHGKIVERVIA